MIIPANALPAKFYDLELRAPPEAAASILRPFPYSTFLTFGVASASLEISFVLFETGLGMGLGGYPVWCYLGPGEGLRLADYFSLSYVLHITMISY
jgi:hypothetical protein